MEERVITDLMVTGQQCKTDDDDDDDDDDV